MSSLHQGKRGENRTCEFAPSRLGRPEVQDKHGLCPDIYIFLSIFHSIVTDDQYASNVPNNIRPDVAMAMDVDHMTAISPHHQGSSVAMVTRGRGRTDDSLSQKAESSEC